jgi:hypothetical protein
MEVKIAKIYVDNDRMQRTVGQFSKKNSKN